jgi:hypothetical protein
MKTKISIRILIIILLCCNTVDAASSAVEVTVEADTYNAAQNILAGKKPIQIDNFEGEIFERTVVEFILAQQALTLGGSKLALSFVTGNYDARNAKLLQDGLLLINVDSMWLSHAKTFINDVYISDPVIRKGEYYAGIFTSLNKQNNITINNLSDFQKLSVISSKHWPVDWQTLLQLRPKSLTHDEEWISMTKLVSMGWIDVMLIPFTKNMPFRYQGVSYDLIAVEGVKIALNDSRHFLVSKHHPHGKETFQALQKGLKILRQKGLIEKAYRQSGFFNDKVKNWTTINEHLLNKKE